MTNLEFKNDSTRGTISNLALDTIVIVIILYPRTGDFLAMVSSAVWVKRLRRENLFRTALPPV